MTPLELAARVEQVGSGLLARVLRRHGEVRIRVGGMSMLPGIRPADVLLIRTVDIASIEPDDVVLFRTGRRLFAHRVVHAGIGGDERVLITRGDMHAHDDPPVTAARLLGRVEGQLRNGELVPAAPPPRRGRGRLARLRFAYHCAMRRAAQSFRSSRLARVLTALEV